MTTHNDESTIEARINRRHKSPENPPAEIESDTRFDIRYHEGPLPPAEDLAAYNRILPSGADRILKMAEREQKAAISLRKLDWIAQFVSILLGKTFLYFLVAATVYLIIKGKSAEALLTGIAPVVSVIYSTFFGSRQKKEEDE